MTSYLLRGKICTVAKPLKKISSAASKGSGAGQYASHGTAKMAFDPASGASKGQRHRVGATPVCRRCRWRRCVLHAGWLSGCGTRRRKRQQRPRRQHAGECRPSSRKLGVGAWAVWSLFKRTMPKSGCKKRQRFVMSISISDHV